MIENNLKIKVASKDKAISNDNVSNFDQRKFISDIYECEKQLYILDARLNELYYKRIGGPTDFPKDFKSSVQYKNYCKEYKSKKDIPNKIDKPSIDATDIIDTFVIFGIIPGSVIGIIVNIIVDIVKDGLFIWPTLLIALIVTIGSVIFNVCMYNSDRKNYNDYCVSVEKIKKYNDEAIKYNNERYKYWKDEYYKERQLASNRFDENEGALIDNEAEMIKGIKSKVVATLKELYNLRINGVLCLHPNYQGLIPISIIYGYFDTGRCSQLQGHEGAYNLYEDEKMKGMIISKLDIVSQQLGELNNAMVYVGKAIEECNERLSDLESTSERMISSVNSMNSNISNQLNGVSNQMSAIESNTANSAYYAEVGAKMTTFNTVYNMLKD